MKIFKVFMVIILVAFLGTVFLSVSGYYQTELQKDMILTNEAIEKFEQDVKDGKDIDASDYLASKQKNYDNRVSKTGRYVSEKLNKIVSNGIKKTLKFIIKAIEE